MNQYKSLRTSQIINRIQLQLSDLALEARTLMNMFRAIDALVAALLLCLLVNYISAVEQEEEDCDTLQYEVASDKLIRLQPKGKRALIRLRTTTLVQSNRNRENTLTIRLQDLDFTILRENGETIDVSKCPEDATLNESLLRPFLANYDENGVLRNVSVTRDESTLAVNLKLYAATFLQINIPQLRGQAALIVERPELAVFGYCTAIDKIRRSDMGATHLKKIVDLGNCSQQADDGRDEETTCLKNSCRQASQRNLEWLSEIDFTVDEINGRPLIQKIDIKQRAKYNPFVQRTTETTADIITTINLKAVKKAKPFLSDSSNNNTEVMSSARRGEVNEDICLRNKSKHLKDLKEVYSALVCQRSLSSLYGDIIERAILCSKP